jgi:hypothetical protein
MKVLTEKVRCGRIIEISSQYSGTLEQEGARMAESDTILQLGIEAAREGNREEARNLFTLLTRQEPNNVQAWLWLAGVADSPEERRAALEQVLSLDPNNDMAAKGLQAMGYAPTAPAAALFAASTEGEPVQAPVAPDIPDRALSDEERYAAELDAAFDDYDSVPKAAQPPREADEYGATETVAAAGIADDDRPRLTPRRATARGMSLPRPQTASPSRLLLLLIAAILLVVLLVLLLPLLFGGRQTASRPTAVPRTPGAVTPGAGTPAPGGGAVTPGVGTPGSGGSTSNVTGTATLPPGGEQPGGGQPGGGDQPGGGQPGGGDQPGGQPGGGEQPGGDGHPPAQFPDPAQANPEVVSVNSQLEANGFGYSFADSVNGRRLCALSCAGVVGPSIGGFRANGTYVVALTLVSNTTGNTQPIPANFFVLKDEQGRVYQAQPAVSSAFRRVGGIADISLEDNVPANGLLYSVPLVFDVELGATGLTLFTLPKQDQGWRVLDRV